MRDHKDANSCMSYVVQHPTHHPPPYCIGFCFNHPPYLFTHPQSCLVTIVPYGPVRVNLQTFDYICNIIKWRIRFDSIFLGFTSAACAAKAGSSDRESCCLRSMRFTFRCLWSIHPTFWYLGSTASRQSTGISRSSSAARMDRVQYIAHHSFASSPSSLAESVCWCYQHSHCYFVFVFVSSSHLKYWSHFRF